MQFQVGTIVVHPNYGLGKVVGIEMIEYMGAKARPYYNVMLENGNIWLPAEPSDDVSIRPVTDKEDLDMYREVLCSEPNPLLEDRHKRNFENKARLKNPTFQTLCEILRDLTAFGWDKKLNDYDTAVLRRAMAALVQEWSVSAGISVDDAQNEIKLLLTRGKEQFAPSVAYDNQS
jgi:RNA polymerase-interacting CarD/CdnL/TRCF family regulator